MFTRCKYEYSTYASPKAYPLVGSKRFYPCCKGKEWNELILVFRYKTDMVSY